MNCEGQSECISVIIPVYKVENYLSKCVESVLSQTYINLEIILVDDGSPDRCGEMCDEYAANDPRVKVIHKKNGGLSDARNAGIDAASGAWIAFVDSDDFIEPTMMEVLYKAALRENAQMAVCNVSQFSDWSSHVMWTIGNEVQSGRECLEQGITGAYIVAWNKLFFRTLWENIRFPVGLTCEDAYVMHHLIAKCNRIVSVSQVLYHYRIRSGSIMRTLGVQNLDLFVALSDRITFYQKIGLTEQSNSVQDTYFYGVHKRFYAVWTENKKDAHLKRFRKANWNVLRLYFRRKDIALKEKLSELVFCLAPAYYKKRWYREESDLSQEHGKSAT